MCVSERESRQVTKKQFTLLCALIFRSPNTHERIKQTQPNKRTGGLRAGAADGAVPIGRCGVGVAPARLARPPFGSHRSSSSGTCSGNSAVPGAAAAAAAAAAATAASSGRRRTDAAAPAISACSSAEIHRFPLAAPRKQTERSGSTQEGVRSNQIAVAKGKERREPATPTQERIGFDRCETKRTSRRKARIHTGPRREVRISLRSVDGGPRHREEAGQVGHVGITFFPTGFFFKVFDTFHLNMACRHCSLQSDEPDGQCPVGEIWRHCDICHNDLTFLHLTVTVGPDRRAPREGKNDHDDDSMIGFFTETERDADHRHRHEEKHFSKIPTSCYLHIV
jgi:hypothetical protein